MLVLPAYCSTISVGHVISLHQEGHVVALRLQDTWIKDKAPKAQNVCLQDHLVRNLKNFRHPTWRRVVVWFLQLSSRSRLIENGSMSIDR